MPRIEILPENWDIYAGDASPTVDVCRSCVDEIREGDAVMGASTPVTDLLKAAGYPDGRIGSTDVDHPCYNDLTDKCLVCGKALDAEKD